MCIIKIVTFKRSFNVTYYKELLIMERIHSLSGSKFFPLRVDHLKRDAIEENHCLIQ